MEHSKVSIHTRKGLNSLNTSVYEEDLQQEKRKVFKGNAKEVIAL
ncbi:hypothetical protein SAMN05444483_105154 [Salegentibacter echinorum]|uniref:Uncharacterized protein n=1 Tax=Salegentibacter echinorum TaxID=1073325 RepID=A0A1M5HHS7_SALEC|nr:hypothetical protein [Salegentibacter echinorum]SHG15438.1 hypothetical protein SAMN05444483_105154 [Salegentibacter echinorum]